MQSLVFAKKINIESTKVLLQKTFHHFCRFKIFFKVSTLHLGVSFQLCCLEYVIATLHLIISNRVYLNLYISTLIKISMIAIK